MATLSKGLTAENPPICKPLNYSAVRLSVLKVLEYIDYDLYLLSAEGKPRLFRSRGIAITTADFNTLEDHGTNILYVKQKDAETIQSMLHHQLKSILQDEEIQIQERFGILQYAVSIEIENAFRLINTNSAVTKSLDIGKNIANLLQGRKMLISDLFGIVRHDYYTFMHVTNVAAFAVLIAEEIGISNQDELNAIATGGLLHDFGKRMISPSILNKKGRLTDAEFDILKAHPQKGYEELCDREELSYGQLMMVYQHHEKLDGSGYPVRVTGEEIHLWAKICAVVDIFDAMTSNRPYRKALSVSFVLDHISQMAGTQLDKEIVLCLTSTMKNDR